VDTSVDPSHPAAHAAEAGLRYVSDTEPGVRRVRCGRGFTYRDPDGAVVRDDRTLDRIRSLAIPPAWTDVWICAHPSGHLQATGRDARGRKQYRYHPRWRTVRDADKFDRLSEFGAGLPTLRSRVARDLQLEGLPRTRVVALVVRLLDETLIRVGNEEYAEENETFGLTTMRTSHASFRRGTVHFDFVGKGGIEHEIAVADARLARIVRRCHELGGKQLFTYIDESGERVPVGSSDVNAYLREVAGEMVSAKDFRTWGGTVLATEYLADQSLDGDPARALVAAVDHAAEALGNTRSVCRSSYIHPDVLRAFPNGDLHAAWAEARPGGRLRKAERATLAITDGG